MTVELVAVKLDVNARDEVRIAGMAVTRLKLTGRTNPSDALIVKEELNIETALLPCTMRYAVEGMMSRMISLSVQELSRCRDRILVQSRHSAIEPFEVTRESLAMPSVLHSTGMRTLRSRGPRRILVNFK
jgi:hypothetical protein